MKNLKRSTFALSILIALLVCAGCGVDLAVAAAEIEEHSQTCSKNDGVKAYGFLDGDSDRGNIVIKVWCVDGAIFDVPVSEWTEAR